LHHPLRSFATLCIIYEMTHVFPYTALSDWFL
jgi:hypothetical protein